MLSISATAALWFAPFVLPICLYVCFTDMRELRITNQANLLLLIVFVLVGLVALPFDQYLWRYVHLLVVLVAGVALNAGGVMGAGDAKFAAAADGPGPRRRACDLPRDRGGLRQLNRPSGNAAH